MKPACSPSPHTAVPRWRRLAGVGLAALVATVLGVTFAAYLNPHTVVDLASRLWACF